MTKVWKDSLKYHLPLFLAPSMKTSTHSKEIRWIDSCCSCSAEWAFQNHWAINTHVPPSGHLFGFETVSGHFLPMHRSWFLDRCNEVWFSKGLTTTSGHSFRISGMIHLLLLGVDPFIVMAQGHWRLCKEIIATFLGFSLSLQGSLLSTMSLFKQCLLNPVY